MSDPSGRDAQDVEALMRHADALLRYARPRVAEPSAAEDLVQETLVAAIAHRDSFEGGSSLRTWLIGILRNKLRDHHRFRARHPSAAAERAENAAEGDDPWFTAEGDWRRDPNVGLEALDVDASHAAERAQLREALARCLSNLSKSLHRVFVLRELEELEPQEVCELTGVTRGSLAVLLHRARHSLRACLQASWSAP